MVKNGREGGKGPQEGGVMRGRDENRTIIKFGFLIFMYVHDWMYMYLCSKLEGGTISCLESS